MVSMEILSSLLNDRELRGQVSRLLTNKVRADVRTLETNALLSRQLLEAAARRQNGQPAGDGAALRGVIKEHLDFYESIVEQTLAFNQRLAARLHGLGVPPSADNATLTMQLAAPLASTVRGPFRLENNRATPIAVSFEITPFVTESGDAMVAAEVAFDPPMLELQPAQEGRIQLVLALAKGFVAGQVYFATVHVKGLDGMQMLVRLHVLPEAAAPAMPESAAPEVAPADVTAPEIAAPDVAAPEPGEPDVAAPQAEDPAAPAKRRGRNGRRKAAAR